MIKKPTVISAFEVASLIGKDPQEAVGVIDRVDFRLLKVKVIPSPPWPLKRFHYLIGGEHEQSPGHGPWRHGFSFVPLWVVYLHGYKTPFYLDVRAAYNLINSVISSVHFVGSLSSFDDLIQEIVGLDCYIQINETQDWILKIKT